jgi:integrase
METSHSERLLYDACVRESPRTASAQESRTVAYIRKYRSGWRAEVQRHGIRSTYTGETKREVQAWALRKEAELDAVKQSKGVTFSQASTKYLSTVSRDKADGATEWEERRLAEMTEFFGEHTMLSQIDSARIGEWRDHRLASVSPSTVLRQRSLLQNLFQVAVDEWKVLQANPFKGVRFPDHNPPRHQVWRWQLIKRLLRAKSLTEREMEAVHAFHIALHTAMRLNEIVSAKVVGRVAVLERDKSSGKASAPVKVPLARKGAELFAKYGPFTLTADQISPIFSDLTDKFLIDGLTFHDSRASALTWLSAAMT